jgi:hypothetical protein
MWDRRNWQHPKGAFLLLIFGHGKVHQFKLVSTGYLIVMVRIGTYIGSRQQGS